MGAGKWLVVALGILFIVAALFLSLGAVVFQVSKESAIRSPYIGEETRQVKALSQKDIDGLLTGSGTPFGGMAKPAELNGYLGPRHVLDAHSAGELELTEDQRKRIEDIYEEMRLEAIKVGKQILDLEKEIDAAFANGEISEEILQEKVSESADLYGRLRTIHLKRHLSMKDILTPEQVGEYNRLRGYSFDNPCENVPEGHDPEMWRLHNNCK